ncbi:MAG: hypothetical protein ACQESP_05680 [Candidatus Muiribacteriota bacterium]
MKKIIFITLLSLICFNIYCFPFFGSQGYALIPNHKLSPSYDKVELSDISGKFKRYSYPLMPEKASVGITNPPSGNKKYDFKYLLGMYDNMLLGAGGTSIGSSSDDNSFYTFGSFYMETVEGLFTAALFYENDDFNWGWCYEQDFGGGMMYFYERKNGYTNHGYEISLGENIYYKKVNTDSDLTFNGSKISGYEAVIYSMSL